MEIESYLTTTQMADALGVSHRRALQLIHERGVPVQRIGTTFVAPRSAVEALAAEARQPGRPRKAAADP
jgi:excisionase family DNA binding protein